MCASLNMGWAGLVGVAVCFALPGSGATAETEAPPTVWASDNTNPYAVIVDRNVFRLSPPPPLVPVVNEPPPNLPVVTLSGFILEGDKVLVALSVKTKDSKAPKEQQERTDYLYLHEGEKDGPVEMVHVRADKEEVDIINSGTPAKLSMKDNGFNLKGAPSGPGTPAVPVVRQYPGAPGLPGGQPQQSYVPPQAGIPGYGGEGDNNALVGGAGPRNYGVNARSYGGGEALVGGAAAQAAPPPASSGIAVPLAGLGLRAGGQPRNVTPPPSGPPQVNPDGGPPAPPLPGGQEQE